MRSFYMRIFKNIICIYVLALCCFAYATMIHAIPDHVYVQEGQKLELDLLYNSDSVTEKTISEYLQSEYLKLGISLNEYGRFHQSHHRYSNL